MLLTISTTHRPATDLGYLLHKNPARSQTFKASMGTAVVWYPEVSEERCTVALLLEIDPVALTRGRQGAGSSSFSLYPYVNDRPYSASSFLTVTMGDLFSTAMNGRSKERQELAETRIPLEAYLPVVPSNGGEELLRKLFEPLGYLVEATPHLLDHRFPEWGMSPYFSLRLRGELRLQQLLEHLYVLIPVLDDQKHYWVGPDEVEKLLRRGEGWLGYHPERELITKRFLKHRRDLIHSAAEQLVDEATAPVEGVDQEQDPQEAVLEKSLGLNQQRLNSVRDHLVASGATRVLDLGCGEGRLLELLLAERQFTEIVGMDVSWRVLKTASERLRLDQLPDMQRKRIRLLQGSLIYRDRRLEGFDAAAIVEVVEHLDPFRLEAFTRVVFGAIKPATVVITTPNRDYNVNWPTLPEGRFRHADHRFEWSREEFRDWCSRIAERFGYEFTIHPVGHVDDATGSPTQLARFTR